ncbi:MAG: hypothetical protein ABI625_23935 [bacterium]
MVVILFASCDNAPWYEGTFIGTTSKHIRYTVANEDPQHYISFADPAGIGCGGTATFVAKGNVLTASTSVSRCEFSLTLTRVNDNVATSVIENELVRLTKQ